MMNKTILIFTILWLTPLFVSCKPATTSVYTKDIQTEDMPRVIILATGGTIAAESKSTADFGYTAGQKPVEELLAAVPEIHDLAQVKGEQVANIGSQDMNTEIWLKLSNRINEIFDNHEADGVVITHGTDTMEETAYFLSLTVHSDKPVVLVGAMRPHTALSQDGSRNLRDAVAVAAAKESQGVGVVVAMNERIFTAREVNKAHTVSTAAFQSGHYGSIGSVHNGSVSYHYKSVRNPDQKFDVSTYDVLPQVDIIYGYAEALPDAVGFYMKFGARGIIYAGVGNGNFSKKVEAALAEAVENGVIVCRSSRTGAGPVTLDNEIDDRKYEFVVADDLSPQKARILLMLALTQTHDTATIQKLFFEY